MANGLSLADLLKLRPDLTPDDLQILAHENTAVLDPYFNESNFITLAANAVHATIVTYTLPPGMLGILRAVAMQTVNVADQNNVIWEIQFNNSPPLGLDVIVGQMATFLFPLNVDMALFDGYTVRVVASNLTALPITGVWAMLRGNFFGRSNRAT